MKIKFASILITLLFLSACVHKMPLKSVEFQAHQQLLSPINQWQFSGKLGIKTPLDSGSASIKWQQNVAAYDIQINGPLGQKSVHIEGDNKSVILKEKGKDAISAHSPEVLIKQVTGWDFPLTQLNYWIRGLPAPKTKIKQITPNNMGLIAQLQQSGWTIDYQSYHQLTLNDQLIYLPKKITAHYQDIRLTLIVHEWTL